MNIKVTHINEIQPVTIQVKEDGEMVECNHAGAFETLEDFGYPSYEIGDWVEDERPVRNCDKCDHWEEINTEPEA